MPQITSPWVLEHPSNINNLQWLIVTGIGFILIAWLVGKFIIPMIGGMLDERKKAIIDAAAQVENTMHEAEQMRNEYKTRLDGIQEETRIRLEAAVKEAESLQKQIQQEAERDAQTLIQRGYDEVSRERAKAYLRLKEQFVNDVINAAQYAAQRSLGDEDKNRLIDEFIDNVGVKS
jgi:F-type H+-transporting ATPase subunit b